MNPIPTDADRMGRLYLGTLAWIATLVLVMLLVAHTVGMTP